MTFPHPRHRTRLLDAGRSWRKLSRRHDLTRMELEQHELIVGALNVRLCSRAINEVQ